MEKLDRWYKESNTFGVELVLHNKQMMNLIEILYEKKRINIIPAPREVAQERILYLLCIGYHSYAQLLDSI